MNLFGYSTVNKDELLDLSEVTIMADPELLRQISSFLLDCAEKMEKNEDWEHEHFSDSTNYRNNENKGGDLIVFRID